MDGSGFDSRTRSLSGLRSRRDLARVLLSAALGSTPALLTLDDTKAKRSAARKRRSRREQRQ
jgi:hypothetical protein